MEAAKYTRLQSPVRSHPRSSILRQRQLMIPFVCVGILLFLLYSPLSAWPAHQRAPDTNTCHINPQLCRFRFWKQRFASSCASVSAAQAWAGPNASDSNKTAQQPLGVFQVYTPVRVGENYLPGTPEERAEIATDEGDECSMLLMKHTFGYSYGIPFTGNYTPPRCSWTNVLFNLTMTSQGRQYDRLALMFLGDTEVFRTSTAEPTSYGIITHYVKDMTRYSALLKEPQQIIFDLGNLVNDIYTGPFIVTLTATYYSPPLVNPVDPADRIFPISQRLGGTHQPSQFSLPSQSAISSIQLPQNAIRAVVGITSSGNGQEEFWYTNVPTSYTNTWSAVGTTLHGYSSFREIQVLIDGVLAGVAWPFATVFTGGIVPALWRPLVSITAYDLPEYEIDVTPFLPLLLDGAPHNFQIKVMSYDETTNLLNSALGSDWIVSGRVFIWTDSDANHNTTGTIQQQSVPSPNFAFKSQLLQGTNGTNSSVEFDITATRSLYFASTINTSSGNKSVSWVQGLHYNSYMNLTDDGNVQYLRQTTTGTDATIDAGTRRYSYPFTCYSSYNPTGDVNLIADVTQGLENNGVQFFTTGSKGGSGTLATTLNGHAAWQLNVGGNGTTSQSWSWNGVLENAEGAASYHRTVSAVNTVNKAWISQDMEQINGVE